MKITDKVNPIHPDTQVIAIYLGHQIYWTDKNDLVTNVTHNSSMALNHLDEKFFNMYDIIGRNPETLHFLINDEKVTLTELKEIVVSLGIIKENS